MAKDPKNKKNFFKGFKAELKKVIWPTPKQIVNSTIAVVTIVLITAVIVFALDSVFNLFNNAVVNGLKSKIQQQENTSVVENQVNEENNTESNNQIDNNTVENEIAE